MMRKLDVPGTAAQITAFLRKTVHEAGFSQVVVAVSGGIDSAVAATLAVAALGPQAVFALCLPHEEWHKEALERTDLLLRQLRIPAAHIREINIASIVGAFARALDLQPQLQGPSGSATPANEEIDQIRLGNIMARTRMVALFDYARRHSALVVGTENKSEHYLGYYTRFGDEASDIEPLRSLYKTEIFQLARHLGIPQEIQKAIPSAGLWPEQTDEGQFGFTYEDADPILYGLYDMKQSPRELVAAGIDRGTIERVQAWVEAMAFKHTLPWLAPEPV